MFVGLFENKLVLNVLCENTFDKSDDYLSKFASVFNARSSIIKHPLLTFVLQLSNTSSQPSAPNIPQFKIISKVRFLSTHPIYLNKLLLRTVRQSQFFGNLKFAELSQIWKSVNFCHILRFLTIFAGEGG